ncbi:hypothetical protein [Magnetospira thiophila]
MVRQISGPACACDPAGRAAFTLTEIDALVAAARQWESRDGHPRYIRIAEDRRMVQVAEDFPPPCQTRRPPRFGLRKATHSGRPVS